MTHKELVKRASAWLRNNQRCTVVITELSTSTSETPDAIGFWSSGGNAILIECKVSRSDFLADKKKWFRQCPEMGMGSQRYMLMPKGMIKPEELPDKWGLLEATESQIRIKKKSEFFSEINKKAEVTMLVSVLRRLEISTAVFVRQD